MFSLLRNRFGIPGLIAVGALVFAMIGGAYAANDSGSGATASAKAKKGPRGPKGAKGDTGAAGPQGPAGPAGAAGAKGENGPAGAAGAAGGVGATGAKGATGNAGAGGAAGATGATGATGASGFGETLPSGKTLTGTWFMQGNGGIAGTSISFALPLSAAPTFHYIKALEAAPSGCAGGTGLNPKAAPGNVCVYEVGRLNLSEPQSQVGGEDNPKLGITLMALQEEAEETFTLARGTWAVTAP